MASQILSSTNFKEILKRASKHWLVNKDTKITALLAYSCTKINPFFRIEISCLYIYLIKHNRHFLSTYFFVNPFKLLYWSYDIRWELVDKPPIIIMISLRSIRQFERINKKICRRKRSIMFNQICIHEEMLPIYIYIYIYISYLPNPSTLAGYDTRSIFLSGV